MAVKKNNSSGFIDAVATANTAVSDDKATDLVPLAGANNVVILPVNTAPTFMIGGNGKVATNLSSLEDKAYSITINKDGKILLSGYSRNDFALVRYNTDGSLDASFDGDGKVITDIGSAGDSGRSVTLLNDGKILVGGYSSPEFGVSDFALARYNSDGTLDTSFNGDGKVTTDFGAGDYGYDITLQADGKILVGGISTSNPFEDGDFALVRYNTNGSLDNSFDGDGKVTTDFGALESGNAIAVQANGKILVAGSTQLSAFHKADFALVRYNSNGSLDTSFDGDGKLTTDFSTSNDEITAITVQADGKILVAGSSDKDFYFGSNISSDFALARYNSNGTLDTSFGGDGKVTTNFGGNDFGQSITLQSDGKILVAGYSINSSDSYFALARYNKDGSLDTSFSGDGKVTTALGFLNQGYSVSLQADGKILVAGTTKTFVNGPLPYSVNTFAVVRYNQDGSLDNTFGGDNTVATTAQYTENATAIVLDNTVQIYDAELANKGNYNGASITLARHGGANNQDAFSSSGSLSFNVGKALLSGVNIGNVSNSNGTLKITFNANATQDRVNTALSSLTYKSTSNAPPASVQIDWTFNDGNAGGQGTGGALKTLSAMVVNISPVNDLPSGSVSISGLATQGQTLTATNTLADADGLGPITYTWKSGATILGTGNTYTVKATDVGNTVKVTASYIDHGGTHESLSSSSTAVIGVTKTGTANANVLVGTVGNDGLSGLGGSDSLSGGNGDDILNGGTGSDKLIGGTGNDTYVVDSISDVVTEAAGGGTDTIRSSVSLTLAANVENLTLLGTAAINGTGNNLNNSLIGNAANNALSGGAGTDTVNGGAGDDVLNGGLGNDRLTGGAGQDKFVFNTALTANIDKIIDFAVVDDTIQLENAIFTKLTATGVLNSADFKIGAATDANDFVVYNQATGGLFYDADGNGAGTAVQIAILGSHLALTHADFVVT